MAGEDVLCSSDCESSAMIRDCCLSARSKLVRTDWEGAVACCRDEDVGMTPSSFKRERLEQEMLVFQTFARGGHGGECRGWMRDGCERIATRVSATCREAM